MVGYVDGCPRSGVLLLCGLSCCGLHCVTVAATDIAISTLKTSSTTQQQQHQYQHQRFDIRKPQSPSSPLQVGVGVRSLFVKVVVLVACHATIITIISIISALCLKCCGWGVLFVGVRNWTYWLGVGRWRSGSGNNDQAFGHTLAIGDADASGFNLFLGAVG